ncbi:hypothetical protein ABK040_015349 [Willaertia magna]
MSETIKKFNNYRNLNFIQNAESHLNYFNYLFDNFKYLLEETDSVTFNSNFFLEIPQEVFQGNILLFIEPFSNDYFNFLLVSKKCFVNLIYNIYYWKFYCNNVLKCDYLSSNSNYSLKEELNVTIKYFIKQITKLEAFCNPLQKEENIENYLIEICKTLIRQVAIIKVNYYKIYKINIPKNLLNLILPLQNLENQNDLILQKRKLYKSTTSIIKLGLSFYREKEIIENFFIVDFYKNKKGNDFYFFYKKEITDCGIEFNLIYFTKENEQSFDNKIIDQLLVYNNNSLQLNYNNNYKLNNLLSFQFENFLFLEYQLKLLLTLIKNKLFNGILFTSYNELFNYLFDINFNPTINEKLVELRKEFYNFKTILTILKENEKELILKKGNLKKIKSFKNVNSNLDKQVLNDFSTKFKKYFDVYLYQILKPLKMEYVGKKIVKVKALFLLLDNYKLNFVKINWDNDMIVKLYSAIDCNLNYTIPYSTN